MAGWREWVERSVGPGARVVRSRRLHGGITSVVHGVDVVDGRGARRRLVLRTYPPDGWIAQEPELVEAELRALAVLEAAGLDGVPRPVAADEDGSEVGRPAVLSTRVPGRPILGGMDEDRWVDGLAEGIVANLAALRAVDAGALHDYRPWHGPEVVAPAWVRDPAGWLRALSATTGGVPPSAVPRQAIHRDSNPGNLLWHRGRIRGVVDWVHLCRGPVEDDVARCRVNVWLLAGRSAADRFLRAVEGAGIAYHRGWDLALLADLGHHLDGFAAAAAHLGRETTTGQVRRRAEEIARSGV